MLARFAVKQKETETMKTWQAKSQSIAAKSGSVPPKKRDLRPCWINALLPPDMLEKVFERLTGRELFKASQVCRNFRNTQERLELWASRFEVELEGVPFDYDTFKEAKVAFRRSFMDWHMVINTLEWLEKLEHPTDVSGTKNGVPLRKRVMDMLILTTALTGPNIAASRRETIRKLGTWSFANLISNPSHHVQEKAMATLANVLSSGNLGRQTLVRTGVLKVLKKMLFSNCIGLQKQASRALINAWIDDPRRVVQGQRIPKATFLHALPFIASCRHERVTPRPRAHGAPSSYFAPHIVDAPALVPKTLADSWSNHHVVLFWWTAGCCSSMLRSPSRDRYRPGRVDWLCTQFSPGGDANALQHLTMYTDEQGQLKGVGEDEQGAFTLHEASLNRALQWANGPSLEGVQERPARQQTGSVVRIGSEGILKEALDGQGGATPKTLQRSFSLAVEKEAGNEVMERMRGRQERYSKSTSHLTTSQGGKMLSVCEGTEHLEILKTHETAHGLDHVKLIAFADAEGLFGIWEMGRFYFQDKVEGGTRGVFRMWQLDRDTYDD
jgi:hypothetical protein